MKSYYEIKTNLYRSIAIVCFLFFWELISRMEYVNPLLFPAPSSVFTALLEWAQSGKLLIDVQTSCWRLVIGFSIGSFFGICIGLLTGRSNIISNILNPILQLLRPLPPVAIIPLVIVWLGIGNTAKIFSISFGAFFPVWINTHLGAKSISNIYLWSADILTKNKIKKWTMVYLPAALPLIIAGLRTALSLAFIMVYVSEIAGASSGIGYRISVSHLAYRIDIMVAALGILALAGATTDLIFKIIIQRLFPWYK